MKNVLFICSQNRLRSPTAEQVFSNRDDIGVLSAGLDSTCGNPVTPELLEWASIVFVIAGHLLPLGPAALQLNAATATTGMAIFFTLSGFLITSLLLKDPRVKPFLIRRLFRIVPLAWLAMLVLALVNRPDFLTLTAHLLFVANLPPPDLMPGGSHLWSLCVEVQFYAAIALLVGVGGRRGLYALPLFALAVTLVRVANGQPINIVTWYRVDEILAGGCVALMMDWRRTWGWMSVPPNSMTLAPSSPWLTTK